MKYKGNIDLRGNLGVQSGKAITVNSGAELVVNGTANFNTNDTRFNARADFNGTARHDGTTEFYGAANFDGQVTNREVGLDPETDFNGAFNKEIIWDWSEANSFHVTLRRGLTVHAPTGIPSNRAIQVNLVTQQSDLGFYRLLWSDKFKFPSGTQAVPTQSRGSVDVYSFHVSPSLSSAKILTVSAKNLFYST